MAFKIVFTVLAIALAIGLGLGAALDVSQAWDVWAYHLPFAARLVGIADAGSYAFSAENAARFAGFPLVAEALQGLFWRLTGRPESANFVALSSLFALVGYLTRVHRVPAAVALLAFLGIPLVQTHATGCYIDLPSNVCAVLLLLTVYRGVVRREQVTLQALVLAALAANMKFQLLPIVVVALGVLFLFSQRRWMLVLAVPIVLATPIKNVVMHHNPVWPVEVHALGIDFPYAETAYASSPVYLEKVSRPQRFAWSVLEVGLAPIESQRRWSVDQYTPPSEPGYRMGGFFGAYVAVNLAALLAYAAWKRSRAALLAVAFVGGATAVTCMLPQSHELRYYLYWMLLLVSMNLALWAPEFPRATGLVAACACAVVLWGTSARYVYPSGDSFATLVHDKVDRALLDRAAPGQPLCVAREPWTFLYAPMFHPERPPYTVQEATRESECTR
ncbi:hypothetical protein LVJ94_32060 [Pendulispora rubella]|uniref:Glycosyltransferase RgtA/B/C/D-like domain-containing protein n=1 Tax=Pendulispora rubella TaxID=2741070 RepID=A0ABZ2KYY9_9BACT